MYNYVNVCMCSGLRGEKVNFYKCLCVNGCVGQEHYCWGSNLEWVAGAKVQRFSLSACSFPFLLVGLRVQMLQAWILTLKGWKALCSRVGLGSIQPPSTQRLCIVQGCEFIHWVILLPASSKALFVTSDPWRVGSCVFTHDSNIQPWALSFHVLFN